MGGAGDESGSTQQRQLNMAVKDAQMLITPGDGRALAGPRWGWVP